MGNYSGTLFMPPDDPQDLHPQHLYMIYSEGRSLSHTIIKEKDMPEARTCHLPNSTALFCIGIDRHGAEIVVTDMTKLGGGR